MEYLILNGFEKDILQMSPFIVNTLIQSISEVLMNYFKYIDRYVDNFGSDVVLQVI